MNAYLNLYKYRLDRSKTVRHWRTSFVEYRGTAELLRVLAHFIPFGLSLDLLYLCGDDPAVYRTVREIVSDKEPGRTEVGQNTAKEILLQSILQSNAFVGEESDIVIHQLHSYTMI